MVDLATYRARIGTFVQRKHGGPTSGRWTDCFRLRRRSGIERRRYKLSPVQPIMDKPGIACHGFPELFKQERARFVPNGDSNSYFYHLHRAVIKKVGRVFSSFPKRQGSVAFIMMLLFIAGVELNPGPNGGTIGFAEVNAVSQNIGNNWTKLARRLFNFQSVLVTENDIIDNCKAEKDTYDRCYQMLVRWIRHYSDPSRENLLQALEDVELLSVANIIRALPVSRKRKGTSEDDDTRRKRQRTQNIESQTSTAAGTAPPPDSPPSSPNLPPSSPDPTPSSPDSSSPAPSESSSSSRSSSGSDTHSEERGTFMQGPVAHIAINDAFDVANNPVSSQQFDEHLLEVFSSYKDTVNHTAKRYIRDTLDTTKSSEEIFEKFEKIQKMHLTFFEALNKFGKITPGSVRIEFLCQDVNSLDSLCYTYEMQKYLQGLIVTDEFKDKFRLSKAHVVVKMEYSSYGNFRRMFLCKPTAENESETFPRDQYAKCSPIIPCLKFLDLEPLQQFKFPIDNDCVSQSQSEFQCLQWLLSTAGNLVKSTRAYNASLERELTVAELECFQTKKRNEALTRDFKTSETKTRMLEHHNSELEKELEKAQNVLVERVDQVNKLTEKNTSLVRRFETLQKALVEPLGTQLAEEKQQGKGSLSKPFISDPSLTKDTPSSVKTIESPADTNLPADADRISKRSILQKTLLGYIQSRNTAAIRTFSSEHASDIAVIAGEPGDDGQCPLVTAAESGYQDIVEILLQCGVPVDSVDDRGRTGLMEASSYGHFDIVEKFIKSDANINQKDADGDFSLFLASQYGHVKIVKHLLEHGAVVDLQDNQEGWSSLFTASINGHKDIVKMLIAHGANVDLQNNNGASSLYIASQNGHKDIVEMLIAHGATVDLQRNDGVSSLYIASQNGHKDVVEMLIAHGANVDLQRNDGASSLYIASQNGHKDVVEMLIAHGANVDLQENDGVSSLYVASHNGHKDVVEMLIAHNADFNLKTLHKSSPLTMSSEKGHLGVVKLLLKSGTQIDNQTQSGFSSLHYAASAGHLGVVKELLNHGANINVMDLDGNTPLHVAAAKGQEAIAKALIEAGADANRVNNSGETFQTVARKHGHEEVAILDFKKLVEACRVKKMMKLILYIADKVVTIINWRRFARHLVIADIHTLESTISDIDRNTLWNAEELGYKVLYQWLMYQGEDATVHALIEALKECEMENAIDQVTEIAEKMKLE